MGPLAQATSSNGTELEQVTCGSAEQEILRAEERKRVLHALAALSSRRREVLVLRYYLGLSEAEIATVLGIRTGTVKSTAARGSGVWGPDYRGRSNGHW